MLLRIENGQFPSNRKAISLGLFLAVRNMMPKISKNGVLDDLYSINLLNILIHIIIISFIIISFLIKV